MMFILAGYRYRFHRRNREDKVTRLDKYLCNMGVGTRSQVKEAIKKGQVTVNGSVVKQAEQKVKEEKDEICVCGKPVLYRSFFYYMLNKPAGVVSATTDAKEKTVLDLLKDAPGKDLFPVGRLDKDTEGLLLITNDGVLSHNLLSPKKHVEKRYYVETLDCVSDDMIAWLKQGVDIGEKKLTLPAKVESVDSHHIMLTITEGKFHQVKRMLKAVGNEVVYLKRLSMGNIQLDETLPLGHFRSLTEEEIRILLCYKI